MPRVRTNNGTILEFQRDIAVPHGKDAPTELVRITPEGVNLTSDQANAALSLFEEVVRVPRKRK